MKAVIIYGSTTGNTQAMAEAIAEGVRSKGAEADVFEADSFDTSTIGNYDSIALGSPAMGAEELEDSMEGLYLALESSLSGKEVSLFGSYDWGDGQWIRDWEQRINDNGGKVKQSLICQNTPEDAQIEECKAFGGKMV